VTSEEWFKVAAAYHARINATLGSPPEAGFPMWVTYIEHSVELNAELLVTREANVLEVLRRIRVVIDAGLPEVLEAAERLGGVLAIAPLMPQEIPRPKFGAFVDPDWGRR
jgi:hypothetical protein